MMIRRWLHNSETQMAQIASDRRRILEDYVRYCDAHERAARIENDSVMVSVPWTHVNGTNGVDSVPCETFREVRAALGY